MNSDDDAQRRKLTFDVETAIAASPSNPGVFSIFSVRPSRFEIACTEDVLGVTSYVRVNNGQYDDSTLRYVPVFSPRVIEGDELFMSTRKWSAPFAITTLVMLSNNRTRYVYVTPERQRSGLSEFIEDENLKSFGHDILISDQGSSQWDDYEDLGFDQYRVIFFNTQFTPNPDFFEETNTALLVEGNTERGTLTFYNGLGAGSAQSRQIKYYGEAMLSAAIFSQDLKHFDCNMAKIADRWQTSIKILQDRLPTISSGANARCMGHYTQAQTILNDINLDPAMLSDADMGKLDRLQTINRLLLTNACPQVY